MHILPLCLYSASGVISLWSKAQSEPLHQIWTGFISMCLSAWRSAEASSPTPRQSSTHTTSETRCLSVLPVPASAQHEFIRHSSCGRCLELATVFVVSWSAVNSLFWKINLIYPNVFMDFKVLMRVWEFTVFGIFFIFYIWAALLNIRASLNLNPVDLRRYSMSSRRKIYIIWIF